MRLRYSSHSPYVRKVLLVAHEIGIAHQIEHVPTKLRVTDTDFWHENPLGKIPVLTLEDGTSYFDSNVICEYLDATYGNDALLPQSGGLRWRALTLISLIDGVVDAGMLARQETLRSEPFRDPGTTAFHMGKVDRGLDKLEEAVACDHFAAQFDMVGIAVASGLAWLTMRFGAETIFGRRPALSAWYELVCGRPSMKATDHQRADAEANAANSELATTTRDGK